jgi:formylglycine-generating enzyme required for sulfatase activity
MCVWPRAVEWCEHAQLELPTEAQWEFAWRAGLPVEAYEELSEEQVGEIAWHSQNLERDPKFRRVLMTVAQKAPNPFGLYDMLGGTSEWCSDYFTDEPDTTAVQDPTGPPTGMIDVRGVEPEKMRVVRGGRSGSPHSYIRLSWRGGAAPTGHAYGFRPVRNLP